MSPAPIDEAPRNLNRVAGALLSAWVAFSISTILGLGLGSLITMTLAGVFGATPAARPFAKFGVALAAGLYAAQVVALLGAFLGLGGAIVLALFVATIVSAVAVIVATNVEIRLRVASVEVVHSSSGRRARRPR